MVAMMEMPFEIESIQNGWLILCVQQHKEFMFRLYASYLDYDTPLDWLKSIYCTLKYKIPLCLVLDGEDEHTIISSGYHSTYVHCIDKFYVTIDNINYSILAKSLYNQLLQFKNNIYDWFDERIKPEEYENRKLIIDNLINEINSLLLIEKI